MAPAICRAGLGRRRTPSSGGGGGARVVARGRCVRRLGLHRVPRSGARYLLLPFAAAIVFAAAAAQLPIPGVPLAVRRLVVVLALAAAVATGALRNAPHDDHRGRLAIDTVRAAVPDGSLVVASWADATALAYASFVEHSLGTRIVVLGWPSDFTGDYPSWTRTRRVIVFAGFYGMLDLERRPLLRVWMHALPSPTPNYQIVEIRP